MAHSPEGGPGTGTDDTRSLSRPSLSKASPALDLEALSKRQQLAGSALMDALHFDSSDLYRRYRPESSTSPPLLASGNSSDSLAQLVHEAITPLDATSPLVVDGKKQSLEVEETWEAAHGRRVLELLAAAHAANATPVDPNAPTAKQ